MASHSQRRSPAERRAARGRAAQAAECAIARLKLKVVELEATVAGLRVALGGDGPVGTEVANRLLAARPAVELEVRRAHVGSVAKIRRNVGLHSLMGTGFNPAEADLATLRRAQKGLFPLNWRRPVPCAYYLDRMLPVGAIVFKVEILEGFRMDLGWRAEPAFCS